MNEVKITGTLVSDADIRAREDGVHTATAHLSFNDKNGSVLLFCIDERVRHLERFKSGDYIRVFGRLVIHPQNFKASILVDRTESMDRGKDLPQDREAEEWNTARRFQANAKVANTRWATRARW